MCVATTLQLQPNHNWLHCLCRHTSFDAQAAAAFQLQAGQAHWAGHDTSLSLFHTEPLEAKLLPWPIYKELTARLHNGQWTTPAGRM